MTDATNIDEAMLAFQADPPSLTKDKRAHNSKYADLVQATDAILPKLNAVGVTWMTSTRFTDDGKFVLDYTLKHVASGTERPGVWPLKLSENPQQMGSQVTYARRYALMVATGVTAEDEDDDGNAASGRQTAQRAQQGRGRQQPAQEGRPVQRSERPASGRPPLPGENEPVRPEQHRHMHALWNELGYGGDENRATRLARTANILGLPDLNSSSDLTRGQADQVIAALKARKEKLRQQAQAEGGAE
jgi:hypothetical protein